MMKTNRMDPIMPKQIIVSWAALFILLTSSVAAARELSPIRRTTIATANADASLKFYRDFLGFSVEYDEMVRDPTTLALFLPGAKEARVIALRQGDNLGGSVGLFSAEGLQAPESCPTRALPGNVALLLLTDDLQSIYTRLKSAHVTFVSDTVTYSASRGPTDAFTVFDPNCVRVSIARIRDPAARPTQ